MIAPVRCTFAPFNSGKVKEKMKPEIKKLWVEALRSGEYVQGTQSLRTGEDGFCCLGVLCDLAKKAGIGEWKQKVKFFGDDGCRNGLGFWVFEADGNSEKNYLPRPIVEWAGVRQASPYMAGVGDKLANLNDNGCTFKQIASMIEENGDEI
jgi:hypothetical protein